MNTSTTLAKAFTQGNNPSSESTKPQLGPCILITRLSVKAPSRRFAVCGAWSEI